MTDFDPARYWEARLSSRFDLGSVGYIGLGKGYNGWVYRVRERIVSRAVRQRFGTRRDLRVLDVGSGTGFYVRLWRYLGFTDVTGSDLTETSVKALRDALPAVSVHQFDVGSSERGFDDETFDIVSVMDVLPHIVDDDNYRRAFANCARLLRPDGTLLFTEYLAPSEHRAEHEVVRQRDHAVRALDDAGFEIVETKPLFVIMNNPICARPVYSKLWRILVAPAHIHEAVGWALGAVLYPIERILTSRVSDGPSAKLIVCARREANVTRGTALPDRPDEGRG